MTDKIHVGQSGAPQTMPATLYARALDADAARPILGDRHTMDLVAQLDYDWSKHHHRTDRAVGDDAQRALRRVGPQFPAVHAKAGVLHLGYGLDSRYLRIAPGPDVEWYDVDYPDVAALRTQLVPHREHNHVVAASVTEPGYLADIPSDRPALLLGEGLTMYLTRADGVAWQSPSDSDAFAGLPWPYRVMATVMSRAATFGYMAQYHRYAF